MNKEDLIAENYKFDFDEKTETYFCKNCLKKYSRSDILEMKASDVLKKIKYKSTNNDHSETNGYYYCGECFEIEYSFYYEGMVD